MSKSARSSPRTFGLRFRLLLGIGLILVLGHVILHFSNRIETQRVGQAYALENARMAEKNLRYTLDQLRESHGLALQSLARDPSLRNFLAAGDEVQIRDLLKLKERGMGMSRLWWFDDNQQLRHPERKQPWPRLDEMVKAAPTTDVTVLILATESGTLSLVAAAPVHDDAGKLLAVIAAERAMDDGFIRRLGDRGFQVALTRRHKGGDWRVMANGMEPGLDADALTALGRSFDESQTAQPAGKAPAAIKGTFSYEESALRFFPLPDAPDNRYLLVLRTDASRHMGLAEQADWNALTALLLSLLAAGTLIMLLSRSVQRKLGEATHLVRRTTDGDFSAMPAGKPGLPEFSGLIQALSLMRDGLKARERNIMRVAYRDPVTGLPNQNALQERLQDVIQKRSHLSKPVFLLVLAVDEIRDVNDTFGPQVADLLMSQIAERLRRLLRQVDNTSADDRRENRRESEMMFSRLSGAQFAVFVGQGDEDRHRALAIRLIHALDEDFENDGQTFSLTGRCGIASYPHHAKSAAGLLTAASAASIEAARDISRIAIVDPDSERRRDLQLNLLNELRRAVTSRQLHLNFQPKVLLSQEPRLMAEAFLRWDHPERGPQNPAQFVPFAEKTGFITELTHWVLESSLEQVAQWRKENLKIDIAVNVTMRDLADPEFASRVVTLVRGAKVKASSLTIEVPEESLFSPVAQVGESILILSRFGVRIAVDNFAKAFVHAHRLVELKVAYVKISRGFISRLDTDKAARVIVKAVAELAHASNIRVVAEGVEKPEILGLLRRLGVDEAQGYAISRPLRTEEYRAWIRHQAERFAQPEGFNELEHDGTVETL